LDRNNVDLILDSTENKFVAHSVGRHELHLRPKPTFYEVYHELQHYRHLRGVGYTSFSQTSEALREQYVYDQLRLSTHLWHNVLNQAERDNAFLYILLKGQPHVNSSAWISLTWSAFASLPTCTDRVEP
jgi:hypothetical protein